MTIHLQREIEKLKKLILSLGAMVEENLSDAKKTISCYDKDVVVKANKRDSEVDAMEVEIEEECLKILALHQPVAIDLRFVISVLKINNDLERASDLATNIANQSKMFSNNQNLCPIDFNKMFEIVQSMLKDALDSLVTMDIKLANKVCGDDELVDQKRSDVKNKTIALIKDDASKSNSFIATLIVSRNLERIADLATNIAEDVIYMVEGKIVRHLS